jgi:hypothetical protein
MGDVGQLKKKVDYSPSEEEQIAMYNQLKNLPQYAQLRQALGANS